MNKRKTKYAILIILFSIAVIFSAILSFIPISKLCDSDIGVESTCSKVLTSKYSKTFEIPNTYIGLVAFFVLLVLTVLQMKYPTKKKESILNFGIVSTSFFALFLIYTQIFSIGQICKYCMVIDISSVLALITLGFFGSD